MSAGLVTLFAMLAFIGITIWVFVIKDKKDFDEQAHLPLDEADREQQQDNKEESS